MKAKELVFSGLFVALMAIGANVSSFLMIGGVPITFQLMFAIFAGTLLGSRLGAFAMFAYMFVGLAGAPVFAQLKGGPVQLLSPTFGFIVSFIFVAYVTGKLIGDRKQVAVSSYALAGIWSLLGNYLIGTNWMYAAFKIWADAPETFSYLMAWGWMIVYLPIDIGVTVVSLSIIPKLRNVLNRTYQPTVKEESIN